MNSQTFAEDTDWQVIFFLLSIADSLLIMYWVISVIRLERRPYSSFACTNWLNPFSPAAEQQCGATKRHRPLLRIKILHKQWAKGSRKLLYFPLDHFASFPPRSFNTSVFFFFLLLLLFFFKFVLNSEPNGKRYLSWAGCPDSTGFSA